MPLIDTACPRRVSQHVWLLPGCQVVLRHSSSRWVVRTCDRPLDATHLRRGPSGVPGFRSGSVPRTHVGPLSRHGFPEADTAVGCSISRPGTPRHPPRAGRPRRIPFQAARPAWTISFPWFRSSFCPRRQRERRRLIRLRA